MAMGQNKERIYARAGKTEDDEAYLLFKLKAFAFVLILQLVLLYLDTLEGFDAAFDRSGESFDVP